MGTIQVLFAAAFFLFCSSYVLRREHVQVLDEDILTPPQRALHNRQVDEPVINVVMAMYGTESGMVSEMEVFLKSLLLNSPRSSDAKVNVYILTNQEAFAAIGPSIFHRMGIPYSRNSTNSTLSQTTTAALRWWLPFEIFVINVQRFSRGWMTEIDGLRLSRNETKWLHVYDVHTEGTFYRWFANRVLPSDVYYFLYTDSDVVLLTDISALWELTKSSSPNVLFQWNIPRNAGFMLVKNTAELWDLVTKVDLLQLNSSRYDDQDLFVLIHQNHPNRVNVLPNDWNYALEWGYYIRKNLQESRPQLGMGHFNGNGGEPGAWWDLPDNVAWMRQHRERDPMFSAFLYYVDLPWSQVQYMAMSKLRYSHHPGYLVTATFIEDPTKWSLSKAFRREL